jgi:cytochrome bd-type quinol oxidase subunit 2
VQERKSSEKVIEWILLTLIFVLVGVLVDHELKEKVKNESIRTLILFAAMITTGFLLLLATVPKITPEAIQEYIWRMVLASAMILGAWRGLKQSLSKKEK